MTTKDKIRSHIASVPPFPTTHAELAGRLGVSPQGVATALGAMLGAGTIRVSRKEGKKRVYEVVTVQESQEVGRARYALKIAQANLDFALVRQVRS
jgi:DNA-binding MarR family transcriptional regulator